MRHFGRYDGEKIENSVQSKGNCTALQTRNNRGEPLANTAGGASLAETNPISLW